jgi:flagellar FliL protein
MAEEVVETEPAAKKPMLLIIVGIVAVLLLLVAAVLGTMFFTGAFKPKPELTAEQLLLQQEAAESAADGKGEAGKDGKDGKDGKKDGKKDGPPGKLTKKSPELTRFDFSYLQLEREFLTNLTGSRKVMAIQVAVMTRYDERVFDNVKKHEFALRSVMMDVMRQTVDADLSKPDFRKELAVRLRDAMNSLLEKYEDFGGIEDVYFTSFIVQ